MQNKNVAAAAVVVVLSACGGQLTKKSQGEGALYERASLTRGARLYDNWMKEKRLTPPGANPGYAMTAGKATSSTATWRCSECHGWDYRGVEGVNRKGSHYTGVEGVLDARSDAPEEISEVIRGGIEGKGMIAFATQYCDESDVWDLVKFVREGTVDLADRIDEDGKPVGADVATGKTLFEQGLPGTDPMQSCAGCHGSDGRRVNFHTAPQAAEYLGTASDNPWQFQHHVRFGYAGGLVMPAFNDRGWTIQNVLDVLAYTQTLPVQ